LEVMSKRKKLIETKNVVDYDFAIGKAWSGFQRQCLKLKPSKPELRRRWLRYRFTRFVFNYFKSMNKKSPNPIGDEEHFFRNYPHLRQKWLKEKERSLMVLPSDAVLFDRWFKTRKYEFQKRWLKKNRCLKKDYLAFEKIIRSETATFCHSRVNWNYLRPKISLGLGLTVLCLLPIVLYIRA
jgi:hypothetical protein